MQEKKIIIMRGLPWTGKSYRAKELSEDGKIPILSTDDFWYQVNKPDKPEEYSFNHRYLSQAHKWNQLRAQKLINLGESLIIDNTNTTAKEFCCDYAKYAHWQDYKVCIEEPTSDRWLEIRELLADKNKENKKKLREWAKTLTEGSKGVHNVPQFAIERMMWRWESDLDPETVIEECCEKHQDKK